jgi:hypothetical protein
MCRNPFCLTPLPGSEDHQKLWREGVAMAPDLNKCDVERVCTAHPTMSKTEWEAIYLEAWSIYYSKEHLRTLLRRAAAVVKNDTKQRFAAWPTEGSCAHD